MPRLATAVLVGALLRRVDRAGGSAMVLARGDAEAGGILILLLDRGRNPRFFEAGVGPAGHRALLPAGPAVIEDDAAATAYVSRRRTLDPDLWVIELDVADGERLAAETILID